MEIFRLSRSRRAHLEACVAIALALPATALFAQQSAPAAAPPATGALLTLPDGWKLLGQDATPSNTPNTGVRKPDTDPQLVNLLITAAPTDPKRNITLSLFRYRFHEPGDPMAQTSPGIDWESAKIEQAVLMQGYMPDTEQVTSGTTSQNLPLITIEVTAKNAAGDERVFTDTAVSSGPGSANSYRLYTSRPVGDPQSAQEVAAIIKSLNIPADAKTPAISQNPGSLMPQPAGDGTQPPAASGTGAATPASGASPQAAQIVQDYHSALIVVEGNKGLGSGFLCKLGGQTYIITNAHVLADNAGVKLTSLDGTSFTTGSSAVAVAHDIVKMQVPTAVPKAFEVMANLDSTAKIGDAVLVPGNAEGAKVVTAEEGKIVGIGPNLIEVDAPFVPGNSGSPIIHVATGKVLGVATYMSIKKVTNGAGTAGAGTVTEEIRRFGYRIDSVKEWQPINWQIFFAESAQVAAIEELSDDFITLSNDGNHLSPENYKNPTLVRVVRTFLEGADQIRQHGSTADKAELLRGFFADLRAAARNDITAFNSQPAYDYFRRDVADQSRFRDELYDSLTRAMQDEEH